MSRSTRTLGILALIAAAAAAIAAAAKLRRRFHPFPVRVAGQSMEPTLLAGDLLAVSPNVEPTLDDIVVVRASGVEMVKRVIEIDADCWHLTGDNRGASTELFVDPDDVSGVVIARYWPKPRLLVKEVAARTKE
jgi:phage repressor protein C with HTH and peptisase S24 domain